MNKGGNDTNDVIIACSFVHIRGAKSLYSAPTVTWYYNFLKVEELMISLVREASKQVLLTAVSKLK